MKQRLQLAVLPSKADRYPAALDFVWDDQTGEFLGPGAGLAETVILLLLPIDNNMPIRPAPEFFALSDNYRHDMTSMAAIFGFAYRLPPELEGFYPYRGTVSNQADAVVY